MRMGCDSVMECVLQRGVKWQKLRIQTLPVHQIFPKKVFGYTGKQFMWRLVGYFYGSTRENDEPVEWGTRIEHHDGMGCYKKKWSIELTLW